MKETMRAAVLRGYHEPLQIEEKPIPVPGPGEVFNLHGWAFTVLDADKKLIRRLRMEPADKAAQALDEAGDNAGA